MKAILVKSGIGLILTTCVMLFSACSNSGGKEENNPLPDDHVSENEEGQEENIPKSEFFISEMNIGSFIFKSSMDIGSSIDKEVIETLSEFNAIGVDDGAKLTLPGDILFDFDSDELHSEADKTIQKLVKVAEETSGDITIVGHTDSLGKENYNQKLSEQRANAVLQALVHSDVSEERLKDEGKGATEPVAQNQHTDGSDNPEGRQKNRRVEVIIHGFNQ